MASVTSKMLFSTFAITVIFFAAPAISGMRSLQNNDLNGNYQSKAPDGTILSILMIDDYFALSSFHPEKRKFNYTWGGPFTINGNSLKIFVEFDTWQKGTVGNEVVANIQPGKDGLEFNGTHFRRHDDGKGDLAGCWRITGRMQNGELVEMPKRARKTLKLLTGAHFQWMAINAETGEFFGTGGGKYSFKEGKYIETIEFFSRDSSRVGASLSFDGKVEGDKWNHSGKSSKGDLISEVWTREKQ